MSERDFVYWLQGFFEMTKSEEIKPWQVKIIKEHLELVLKNETKNTQLGEDLVKGLSGLDSGVRLC